jgi:glycosyltransferase involved in cell wall biosynthesis
VKVHVLTSSWPVHEQDPGGRFVYDSCRALLDAGMELRVHALEPGVELPGAEVQALGEPLDQRVGGVPSRLRQSPRLIVPVLRRLMQPQKGLEEADRVVCHWAFPFPFWAQRQGVHPNTLRTWCHGSGLRQPGGGLWLGRVHPVALVSPHQRRFVPRRFHGSLQVLPVPVAPAVHHSGPVPDRLIFVGRLVRQKGAHLLSAILDELPGWRGVVVGDGPEAAALHQDPRLDCLGALPQGQWFNRVERGVVVCLSTGPEGAPLVVDEARQLGLPVVVSAQLGLAQRVRHEQDGLIVRGMAPKAWAQAVRQAQAHAGRLTAQPSARRGCPAGWSSFVDWVAAPN